MDSILTSIKKMLGIDESYTQFDADIIMHINSVFMILRQMGVGPEDGYFITDSTATWSDYVNNIEFLEAIKSYVYLKVRLLFDPPTSSSVMESTKTMISELEWRLYSTCEYGEKIDE